MGSSLTLILHSEEEEIGKLLTSLLYVRMYIRKYACTHGCTDAHIVYVYVCMYAHTYICACIMKEIGTYVYVHMDEHIVCMCVCMYAHSYIYMCMHHEGFWNLHICKCLHVYV